MLDASSGIDVPPLLRTLRLEGRNGGADCVQGLRFLMGNGVHGECSYELKTKMEEQKLARDSRCRCLHARPPVVCKTDRIPRFGARCWLRLVRRSDLG